MKARNNKQIDPVPAATVILTRQHAGELQVYLLKRTVNSGFMAGNYVFPGGLVDSEDQNVRVLKAHVDLDLDGIDPYTRIKKLILTPMTWKHPYCRWQNPFLGFGTTMEYGGRLQIEMG